MDHPCHILALPQSAPFLARCALSTIFFINGVVLASWIPHIPAVKAQHAIGDGQLGIVLLSMAIGSVLALPLAGGFIARFGGRRMTSIAALGFCLALPLPILSPTIGLLVLSLMLFGFLAEPPLIGVAAEITSLPTALGIVSAFCALIAVSAGVVLYPLGVQTKVIGVPVRTGAMEYGDAAESNRE